MRINRLGKPNVAIIIVNWNGLHLLKKCIPSLFTINYPVTKYTIYVVDNGSTDQSVSWIKKHYPKIKIIKNKTNLGFAKANNIGINEALLNLKNDYILTLNNDTTVEKNWLGEFILFMQNNSKVGIATGKILNFYKRNKIDATGDFVAKGSYRVVNRGKDESDHGQYDYPCEIFSACAASSIYRRKVLEEIKKMGTLFDEDFENYIEDIDLSIRARLLNWKIWYVPNAVIYHVGSATSSSISNEYKEFVSRRNRLWFALKNFPTLLTLLLISKYILPSDVGIIHYGKYTLRNILQDLKIIKTKIKRKSNQNTLTVYTVLRIQLKAVASAFIHSKKIIRKRHVVLQKQKVSNKEIYRWFSELSI